GRRVDEAPPLAQIDDLIEFGCRHTCVRLRGQSGLPRTSSPTCEVSRGVRWRSEGTSMIGGRTLATACTVAIVLVLASYDDSDNSSGSNVAPTDVATSQPCGTHPR